MLASVYSLGAIERVKQYHLELVTPAQSVLYLGCGSGSEVAGALSRGARVTLVDTSSNMLRRAEGKLAKLEGLKAGGLRKRLTVLRADAREVSTRQDHVVLPFFLNVFSSDEVGRVLRHARELVQPGGLLTVVDFSGPSEGATMRAVQRAYYLPPLALFACLAKNPWHPLYDYPKLSGDMGFSDQLVVRRSASVLGMPLFESMTWRIA